MVRQAQRRALQQLDPVGNGGRRCLALGWAIARAIGRAAGPTLFRRMDPGTAGTVGFVIRLLTVAITILIALERRRGERRFADRGERVHRGRPGSRRAADARQPVRRAGAAHAPGRSGSASGCASRPARSAAIHRGDRQLAGADVHDARAGRGPDHDPEQRRALGGRRADPRAQIRRRQGATRLRHPAEPGPGDPRRRGHDADPAAPRRCCSRRSTGTTSSSGCRRRRSRADDGAQLADEIIDALATRHRRAPGRGARDAGTRWTTRSR